jgi:hypothetical protein
MSRLTIDVTDQQHQALKAMAALQGKTIKEYAIERLFPPTADEEAAMQELKALLLERIADAERGNVVEKTAMEIVEDEFRKTGIA